MNTINGTSGNDTLTGTGGSDYLDGGLGADNMIGGGGDDVYLADNPGDIVVEALGEGVDRVNSTVTYSLPDNVEDLWLVGTGNTSGAGNELDNVLWGSVGNNTLQGGAGNDTLDGWTGTDTMLGGTGNDTYWVDNAGDIVSENTDEGSDTVNSSLANYTLGANVENLTLISGAGNINGSGNQLDNQLVGNEGNNVLVGDAGNDSLDGGAGADTMIGGTGNDTYQVDNSGDVVTENPGEGIDTVVSTLTNYTLAANVENLTLGAAYSMENLNGSGNELDNTLRGNSGNNVLNSSAGNDTLIGGNGNDTLTGGTGNDVFYISTGDSGTDTITDLSSGDIIEVCGTFFFDGSVSQGSGTAVASGQVQLSLSGGQTILHVGTDGTPGADVNIVLDGTYSTGNFYLSGFDIRYDSNHPPVLNNPLTDKQAAEGSAFTLHLPADTFTDADGETLVYSATLIDPDWGFMNLPSWLTFDAATRTFSGTPAHGDIGSCIVMVTATDANGASDSGAFTLTVEQPTAPTDTTPPSATIITNANGTSASNVTYALLFSEAVTGLAADDFTVTNGAISSISGSGANYTLIVSPNASTEGNLGLTLKAGAIVDAAGNPNASSAAIPQSIDTCSPTVSTFSGAVEAAGIGLSSNIVFTFSEAIQAGTGNIVLTNDAGTVIETFNAATSSNVSISGATLTITPASDLNNGSVYAVELAAGSIKDKAGNSYTGTTSYHFTDNHASGETVPSPSTANGGIILESTSGNDTFAGGAGTIDGGGGIDTVQYSAFKQALTHNADGTYSVGTDKLANVERLQFTDAKVAIDLDGNAGATAKILGAVFGQSSVLSEPYSKQYVGIGLNYLDNGMSYPDLLLLALNAKLGSGFSNAAEVNLLYQNLVGVPPSTSERDYWVGTLTSGQFTQASLAVMAADLDLNKINIDLVGLHQTGIEYL